MIHLLDVNVLIALVDRGHVHHEYAHQWIIDNSNDSWATCATTENGVIRIISNPNYPNSMQSPAHAAALLSELKKASSHQFWSESVSLLTATVFRLQHIGSHRQITDIYLLGLSVSRGAYFATFDRHINTDAVVNGRPALRVLNPDA